MTILNDMTIDNYNLQHIGNVEQGVLRGGAINVSLLRHSCVQRVLLGGIPLFH